MNRIVGLTLTKATIRPLSWVPPITDWSIGAQDDSWEVRTEWVSGWVTVLKFYGERIPSGKDRQINQHYMSIKAWSPEHYTSYKINSSNIVGTPKWECCWRWWLTLRFTTILPWWELNICTADRIYSKDLGRKNNHVHDHNYQFRKRK